MTSVILWGGILVAMPTAIPLLPLINKLGNRDAWYLARHGYDGDKYLARLMAAILIMRNPESVR
jgi:hypothetical protein